jgi:hypothetical protein
MKLILNNVKALQELEQLDGQNSLSKDGGAEVFQYVEYFVQYQTDENNI